MSLSALSNNDRVFDSSMCLQLCNRSGLNTDIVCYALTQHLIYVSSLALPFLRFFKILFIPNPGYPVILGWFFQARTSSADIVLTYELG